MAEIISLSIPNGDKSWESLLKKYPGGMGKSAIMRDAINALTEKLSSERTCPLPTANYFEKCLFEMKKTETVKETLKLLKQLQNLTQAQIEYREKKVTQRVY